MPKVKSAIPEVVFVRSAPSVAMSEAEQLLAIKLLRSAYTRIGQRPVTFGELLDDINLVDQISGFLKHSGALGSGKNN